MSKFAHKRTAAGHIKEGLKNIKATYKALYNRPGAGPTSGSKTAATNLKIVAGKEVPGIPRQPAKVRAKLGALGAASVTPVGPIAAFAAGVKKSIAEKKADKAMKAEVKAIKKDLAAPKFQPATPSSSARPANAPVIGRKSPPAAAPRPTAMRPAALPKVGSLTLPPAPKPTPVPRRPAPVPKSAGPSLPKAPPPPTG